MRKDKGLQNYFDARLAKYDDEAFKQRLLDKQRANAPAKKKNGGRLVFTLSAVATVLVVAIVATVLLSLYLPNPVVPDNVYMFDNIKDEVSTLQVLNETTKTLDLSYNADSIIVWRYYDEDINIDLYFIIDETVKSYLAEIRFVIVTEFEYNYPIEEMQYKNQCEINGYNVLYEDIIEEESPLFKHTINATFTTATEVVYITYTQITIGDESDFEQVLGMLLV